MYHKSKDTQQFIPNQNVKITKMIVKYQPFDENIYWMVIREIFNNH